MELEIWRKVIFSLEFVFFGVKVVVLSEEEKVCLLLGGDRDEVGVFFGFFFCGGFIF